MQKKTAHTSEAQEDGLTKKRIFWVINCTIVVNLRNAFVVRAQGSPPTTILGRRVHFLTTKQRPTPTLFTPSSAVSSHEQHAKLIGGEIGMHNKL